jgi:hypothetical protein
MTALWGVRKDGRLLTGYGTAVGATSVPAIAALYKGSSGADPHRARRPPHCGGRETEVITPVVGAMKVKTPGPSGTP